jgi:hypothetical protein
MAADEIDTRQGEPEVPSNRPAKPFHSVSGETADRPFFRKTLDSRG